MTDKQWDSEAKKLLLGKMIKAVEYIPKDEADNAGWYERPVSFLIGDPGSNDNDMWVVPLRDDEGNGGGSLSFDSGEILPVL